MVDNRTNEDIVRQIRTDPTNKKELLEVLYMKNTGLMKKIIRDRRLHDIENELMQECFFALVECIKKYDEERGLFSTFLFLYINVSITKYLKRTQDFYIPDHFQNLMYRYKNTTGDYLLTLNRKPTKNEMMQELGIDEKTFELLKDMVNRKVDSLNRKIENEDGTDVFVGDMIADGTDYEALCIDQLQSEYEHNTLMQILQRTLSEREFDIIKRYYFQNETYKKIGEAYGISKGRARQIIMGAFLKLHRSKAERELKEKLLNVRCGTFGTGLHSFRNNWASHEELSAMAIENGIEQVRREFKREHYIK